MRGKTQKSSKNVNNQLEKIANDLNIELKKAKIHSGDVFYGEDKTYWKRIHDEYGCMAVEMESFALFANAKALKKNAACLLTISDSFITSEVTSALERQNSFHNMMKIALGLAK